MSSTQQCNFGFKVVSTIITCVLAVTLCACSSTQKNAPKTGWQLVANAKYGWQKRFILPDGSYPKDKFFNIEGTTYAFDSDGYPNTGLRELSPSGSELSVKDGGKYYLMDKNGVLLKNKETLCGRSNDKGVFDKYSLNQFDKYPDGKPKFYLLPEEDSERAADSGDEEALEELIRNGVEVRNTPLSRIVDLAAENSKLEAKAIADSPSGTKKVNFSKTFTVSDPELLKQPIFCIDSIFSETMDSYRSPVPEAKALAIKRLFNEEGATHFHVRVWNLNQYLIDKKQNPAVIINYASRIVPKSLWTKTVDTETEKVANKKVQDGLISIIDANMEKLLSEQKGK